VKDLVDRISVALSARDDRRRAAGRLLAGLSLALGFGAGLADPAAAKKKRGKKKNKKRNKNKNKRCITYGGISVTCDPGWDCCDPRTSTVAACRLPGFPVCCASDEFAHPAGTTCCDTFLDGIDGICDDPDFPHCCSPAEGAGCCRADLPVCCPIAAGGGCCPLDHPVCCLNACCTAGDFCTEDGFCFFGTGVSAARHGQSDRSSAAKGERRHQTDGRARPLM